ncbi:hypothetical protein PYS58_17830 [Chryseobacterium indologenes]|uniref:hypothetical protein n=1 Tax=Chryseobacterium TaxID=59732 RepID=UPI001626269D|nr:MULTISPECIES: hypothetical protein [Chryseobacterium]MDM1553601.1 hypothetical protein [Chryseobacterium indologenes]WET48428.1 hypothetical protein PYS58_17830 [Chryseobacterium indologenes]
MRLFISIFIIFTVAVRPVLPLINYAVNYDYIVKNLCEKKDIPQSTCKGKCYVEKELAKTEKQSNTSQTIKIAGLDVFISNEILSFSNKKEPEPLVEIPGLYYFDSYSSDYFSRIFHPPLV